VLTQAGLPAPKFGTAYSAPEAVEVAHEIGYPVLVRPSFVLGGRGMEIVYDDETLSQYVSRATALSKGMVSGGHPVLVDRFLDDAIEIDVDALFDGDELFLGAVMEHIEEAGIHSGDSACVLPPVTLGHTEIEQVRASTEALARGIGVRGLLNVQFALAADVLYVLEANPRASRTVPFVSKATAVPLAKAAARIMLGASIAELRTEGMLPAVDGTHLPAGTPVAVKEAVLPFKRFITVDGHVVDSVLGPEMRSTGEVMGLDDDYGTAFAKSQSAAYAGGLPDRGTVFVSVANRDKRAMIFPVKRLVDLGFTVLATEGTAEVLRRNGVESAVVRKHSEGTGPSGELTIVQRILAGEVDMVVNTPSGRDARADGYEIRAATTSMDRPIITTVQQLAAAVQGIESARDGLLSVRSLQEHAALLRTLRSA
jgi:carbamoyl-phosphate synthase large subunit